MSHFSRRNHGIRKTTCLSSRVMTDTTSVQYIPLQDHMHTFLFKMYDLIETSPREIIEWTNDGAAFIIKQPKRFEREILHKYFRNKKSFLRQLKFHRFRKSFKSIQLEGSNIRIRCFEYRQKSFQRKEIEDAKEMEDQLEILATRVAKLSSLIQMFVASEKSFIDRNEELTEFGFYKRQLPTEFWF